MKRLNYINGYTAGDLLVSLISEREKDKAVGLAESYSIYEFPPEECIDNTGEMIRCRSVKVGRLDIDRLGKDLRKEGQIGPSWAKWARTLEDMIGAPALLVLDTIDVKVRPLYEIAEKLNAYRRSAKYELKQLRKIYSEFEESQNPQTVGGLYALNWLFNNGTARESKDISLTLYVAIVSRERDRLFYVSRHPSQKSLHKCQDNELLEKIKILKWALFDVNPFIGATNYNGQSVF